MKKYVYSVAASVLLISTAMPTRRIRRKIGTPLATQALYFNKSQIFDKKYQQVMARRPPRSTRESVLTLNLVILTVTHLRRNWKLASCGIP
jgi:hypothetical protein